MIKDALEGTQEDFEERGSTKACQAGEEVHESEVSCKNKAVMKNQMEQAFQQKVEQEVAEKPQVEPAERPKPI